MDIFKFNSMTPPSNGQIIEGLTSKMWIERFNEAGEFTLIAPVASGVREKLPPGTFVSHTNTREVMVVENHEINDTKGKESEIKITGRSWISILEQRIVGANQTFPTGYTTVQEYILSQSEPWYQALNLIRDHISVNHVLNVTDIIPNVTLFTYLTVGNQASYRRYGTPRKDLYVCLTELLKENNLGVKVTRPGPWAPIPTPPAPNDLILEVYVGADRSTTGFLATLGGAVVFSWDAEEVVSADYLWSNKKKKTAALLTGKWVESYFDSQPSVGGYNKRVMAIDASYLDDWMQTSPSGADRDNVTNAMSTLGSAVVSTQNDVIITKAEITKEGTKNIYRDDYWVGDIVTVSGDYDVSSPMRVVEYVEIEDETGESGYPTLATL